ncbi:unnamed protein product [Effrenium voratum]|nr:unnamed protein product [Effrenium voratum]
MALRLDLIAALKEDIRDHYANHTAQVDTLLVVTTLLFTFGLATLQFSDPFVLKTKEECEDCVEVMNPAIAYVWIVLVASVLLFPFWSLVMALWCKIQLDRWLRGVSKTLNVELRWALRERSALATAAADRARGVSEAAAEERPDDQAQAEPEREVSSASDVSRARTLQGLLRGREPRQVDPGELLGHLCCQPPVAGLTTQLPLWTNTRTSSRSFGQMSAPGSSTCPLALCGSLPLQQRC